jgi:hypothetical protein
MREGLEGETYAGRYVVADARLASPVAAGEGTVVVSPKGFVLFGPLPGDRWIIFVDIDEAYSPELNPKENLWDEIREKIFKNYALKSRQWSRGGSATFPWSMRRGGFAASSA